MLSFNKANTVLLNDYRTLTISKFSKVLENIFMINSLYFKPKTLQFQYRFTKSKSTVINSITYLNSITTVIASQGQTDSLYFYLSQVSDKVRDIIFLQKLNNFGLSLHYTS